MIAREGAVPVLIAVVGSGVLVYAGALWGGVILLAVAVFLGWVYADLPRRFPNAPLSVVSPVDGLVIDVVRGTHRWYEGESLCVRVSVAWPGVKVVRAPAEGQVEDVQTGYRDGGDGSPDDYAVRIRTDEGDDIVYVVRSDWPFSRFRSYAAIGERIGHGRRCGFVYFTTCVEVLLATTAECRVEAGQRARGGVSTLARLSEERST